MKDYNITKKRGYIVAELASDLLREEEFEVEGEEYVLIERVYVDPKHRGKGLAKKMLKTVIDKATKDGYGLKLCAEPLEDGITMEGLCKLYDEVGFSLDEENSGDNVFYAINL